MSANRNALSTEDVCRIMEAVRGLRVAKLEFRGLKVEFLDERQWGERFPTYQGEPSPEVAPAEGDGQPQLPQGSTYRVPVKTETQELKEALEEDDELSELLVTDPVAYEARIAERELE